MNEIIISNIPPQNININEGGVTGITTVYVNGVDVTVGNNAYVLVPTKLSELQNDTHFISQESDPTVPTWVKAIGISDINNWNSKQNQLTAGTNIEINDNVISAPLTDYVKFTDYADYGKAGVIKPQSGSGEASLTYYGFGVADNGQPFAYATSSYIGYDRLHFNAFISKETLETAIEGKELTNKTYVDSANTLQDNEINNLKSENDYLNSIINQLPKVSSQGTILTLNNTINGRMNIELGASELTQDGTPTPTSPQDIHTISGSNKVVVSDGNGNSQEANIDLGDIEYCKIGNYEDKFIKTTGKNLFDKDNVTIGAYLQADGTLLRGVSTDYKVSDFISIKPNTAYYKTATGSPRTKYYNANKEPLNTTSYQDITNGFDAISFTTPTNAYYLRVTINTSVNSLDSIMINKGTTALPYEPYGSNQWYIKKNISKVVLDGTETWYSNQSGEVNMRFHSSVFSNKPIKSYVGLLNYFQVKNNSYKDGANIYAGDRNIYLWMPISTLDTIEEFKTWLSTHNTEVYYPIATPEYILLNDTLQSQLEYIYNQMLAYKGQTNISQINSDLAFNISASALLDLNTLVGE